MKLDIRYVVRRRIYKFRWYFSQKAVTIIAFMFLFSSNYLLRILIYLQEVIISWHLIAAARPAAQLVERWTPGSESPGSRRSGAR